MLSSLIACYRVLRAIPVLAVFFVARPAARSRAEFAIGLLNRNRQGCLAGGVLAGGLFGMVAVNQFKFSGALETQTMSLLSVLLWHAAWRLG
jgi:hypothetical protein